MNSQYSRCLLCPRECGIDRHTSRGVCGESDRIRIARADLHKWEEPPICTGEGSGAIFFSGCSLRCCYCQNFDISQGGKGYEVSVPQLSDIMLRLQDRGACNINLVTATHFVPSVTEALSAVKGRLHIPVVYNSSGYESIDTLKMLEGYVDIYLPDIKYFSSELSQKYSCAPDYFAVASNAVAEMARQTGTPRFSGDAMTRGVIVRHMVLPSHREDSINIMRYLGDTYSRDEILLSIMRQYVPIFKSSEHPEIDRLLTSFEYGKVLDEAEKYGFRWFIQDKASSSTDFIPRFYGKK